MKQYDVGFISKCAAWGIHPDNIKQAGIFSNLYSKAYKGVAKGYTRASNAVKGIKQTPVDIDKAVIDKEQALRQVNEQTKALRKEQALLQDKGDALDPRRAGKRRVKKVLPYIALPGLGAVGYDEYLKKQDNPLSDY